MTTKYIIYHSYSNAIKNRLHDSFEQFIQKNNRVVHDSVPDLKKLIRDEVKLLNKTYSRCKPIEVWFTEHSNIKHHTISIHSNNPIKAEILQIKIKND